MQDYDRNENREEELNTDQSPLSKEMENQNVHKTMEEGMETDDKAALEKEEAAVGQERADPQKEADHPTGMEGQGQAASLNDPSKKEAPYSSVSYTPPYYVPNFTVVRGPKAEDTAAIPEASAKKHSGWVVALAVVLSLLIAFSVGGFSGYCGAMLAQRNRESGQSDLPSGAVTIEKNTASIEIQETLSSETDVYTEVSSVARAVADCVVEITTSQTQTHAYFGQYVTSGAGSGVIIAQNPTTGIIVTNYHVVEGADNVIVRLTNGTEYQATYRGGDESMDIAVLYISLKNGESLSCATFGDSSTLVVGQRVVAIGNPLGSLGGTVTDGIISALDRKISIDDNLMTLLQTNTAINPGNSGGGLFDMAGRLVGIVNAKQSAEGIEGLGFAIPINVIEDAIASITEHGYVQDRPTFGIDVSYMDSTFMAQGSLYSAGLYVANVFGSDSSFRVYDRIVSINGEDIESKIDYNTILSGLAIGQDASVVIHRNGRQYTLTVTVQENTLDR